MGMGDIIDECDDVSAKNASAITQKLVNLLSVVQWTSHRQ